MQQERHVLADTFAQSVGKVPKFFQVEIGRAVATFAFDVAGTPPLSGWLGQVTFDGKSVRR
jgi:hypothetical protein